MLDFYYSEVIKRCCIAFSDIFNDIVIKKYNSAGTIIAEKKVPIAFGHRDKYWDIRKEAEIGKKYYLTLPRLSFTLDGIEYDPERAMSVNTLREVYSESLGLSNIDSVFTDPSPAPYNLSFTLYLKAESMGNFSQIIENILPYFSPSIYLRIREFPFLNIERDLKLTLNGSVNLEFTDDQEETNRRELNSSLNFTLNAWMYSPYTTSKIIKVINSRYYIDQVTSATPTSADAFLVDAYNTSGFWKTSGGILSGTPSESQYDFSAYNTDGECYTFTSAGSN